MAKQVIQLTVFFSGSSEVDAERAAFNKVVEELGRILEKTRDITIKKISWPEDFRPGVNKDIQTEINRQIKDRYDIYLGVLSTRFGTPTQRAGSGTEEEFDIALTKYINDTTSVRVLFYFKKLVLDPFSIDSDQLSKVNNFRSRLSKKGIIYKDFQDTSEFVDIIKNDLLSLIAEEWEKYKWKKIELPFVGENSDILIEKIEEKKQTEGLISNNDEIGYLDLIEDFHAHTFSLVNILEKITGYTTEIGRRFEFHTKNIFELTKKYESKKNIGGSREVQKYFSESKEAVNNAAKDLDVYTHQMSPEVLVFKKELALSLKMFYEYYIFSDQALENPDQKKIDIVAFQEFIKTMNVVVGQVTSFQDTIKSLPNITSKFIKSRKQAAAVLGDLIAEIKIGIDNGWDIISKLNTN